MWKNIQGYRSNTSSTYYALTSFEVLLVHLRIHLWTSDNNEHTAHSSFRHQKLWMTFGILWGYGHPSLWYQVKIFPSAVHVVSETWKGQQSWHERSSFSSFDCLNIFFISFRDFSSQVKLKLLRVPSEQHVFSKPEKLQLLQFFARWQKSFVG